MEEHHLPDVERLPSPGLPSLRDLNDLEVFARVVEQNGFTRAAKDLGVPASTVSRRLARLEEALGVRLLQRTTRKLHLTEAGQIYFDRVSRALREIEVAEVLLRNVQGVPKGRVRVSTVNEPFLDDVFFGFLEKYPEVTLELDKSHRRVDLITEGYDLAIRAGTLPDSSLFAHKLMATGMRCVASPGYLSAHGAPQTLSELAHHSCIIVGGSTALASWQFSSGDTAENVSVVGRVAVNDMATAVRAARRGLGLALLPTHLIEALTRRGELVEVLTHKAPPETAISILYPARALRPPAVTALVDHLIEAFRRDPSLATDPSAQAI
jgi:DNA-binding transcriptional LysR family regulator